MILQLFRPERNTLFNLSKASLHCTVVVVISAKCNRIRNAIPLRRLTKLRALVLCTYVVAIYFHFTKGNSAARDSDEENCNRRSVLAEG